MVSIESQNMVGAWEYMNELFLTRDNRCMFKSRCSYAFDIMIHVDDGRSFDEELDFGALFSYTPQKWRQLISNYLNKAEMVILKRDLYKNQKITNLSYKFANHHKNGKGCIISMVISRRPDNSLNLSIFLRASEVTKRLLMDLLFINRLGLYLFNGSKFSVNIYCPYMFNEDMVLLMYDTHKPLDTIEGIDKEFIRNLKKLRRTSYDKVKYKIHKRVMRSVVPGLSEVGPFLARECRLTL